MTHNQATAFGAEFSVNFLKRLPNKINASVFVKTALQQVSQDVCVKNKSYPNLLA
jgi:hypothetical protein